jgi:anti-sigma regulatory factor (Ser/Thr protein kinase)
MVSDVECFGRELEHSGYDIVIADSAMPGLSPLLLLGEVFRHRPSQALVVVGESVTSDHGLKLLRSGVTDVITKPVDFSWLERCVEQAVCAKRQEERERLTYNFVMREHTEMKFSCQQLGEVQAISIPVVSRLIACGKLPETDGLKLRLAIQEALLNSVEHGNLELLSIWKEETMSDGSDKFSSVRRARMEDPRFASRLVWVSSLLENNTVQITIRDQGKGFNYETMQHRAGSDNFSCFGRGMTLIQNAVDEVRYERGGSQVTLVKRLH